MGYLVATITKSNLWGNILSPIATMITFYYIYQTFYLNNNNNRLLKITGFFFSLSIFTWAISDILWGVFDLIFNIDPNQVEFITYSYALTNLFLAIALCVYGFYQFRKWNGVQVLLDSMVISICVLVLVWVIFLDNNVSNLLTVHTDWVNIVSILLDVIIVIWIFIWFFSIRKGKPPLFYKYMVVGIISFVITDLTYYYRYFDNRYEPNTLLDASYVMAFAFIALGGFLRKNYYTSYKKTVLLNVGNKGKEIYLIIAPILLIIFRGFVMGYLLMLIFVIMIYYMLTIYIQKNIYKEELFIKEKELNIELEQKVITRTKELTQKNKKLDRLLNQDIISGLHNRRYFSSHLKQIEESLLETEQIILLYIDINRFKMINTMFGNYIGDRVLFKIAKRLQEVCPVNKQSILASYGEDIFVVAIKGNYDYNYGLELAQKIMMYCSDIYKIEDYQIRITVNIGVSLYPFDAKSMEELIKNANLAMSQARMKGFNEATAFDSKLAEVVFRKNYVEIMMKRINFNQEFSLHYQPQVNTMDEKVFGFEALLRWKTLAGVEISPGELIPIAEETGLIIAIGDWVMKKALEQLVQWNNKKEEKISVSINVSIKQLNVHQFYENLKNEIERLSLQPDWIDLEITESIQLEENREIRTMIENIRNLGVSISIDDFGTGYSSLGYLRDLPISRIKIAKILIDNIDKDNFDYQLVKSLIMISRVKGIKVIAEGVETKEQWNCLKELQCDEIQGFFFGKPMPVNEIEMKYMN